MFSTILTKLFFLYQYLVTLWHSFIVSILTIDKCPKHVAFIMDGNRRYARSHDLSSYKGHLAGSQTLMQILSACETLHIGYVTVYAFAMENFKRNKEEVDYLMKITEEKIGEFYENRDDFNRRQIRIQIWGELSYLPVSLQHKMKSIMKATSGNKGKVVFTICFAYSSQCEMLYAARKLAQSSSNLCDFTASNYMKSLYSGTTPPPDLLIRTSGEKRLSDFLLTQSTTSQLYFTPIYWPDFTFYRLVIAILNYQRCRKKTANIRREYETVLI